MTYHPNCYGCDISQKICSNDEIIELGKYWIIEHYQGDEAFLGWLTLQTKYHKVDFTKLDYNEAIELGCHIKDIHKALQIYWEGEFGAAPTLDYIERIYVVYFQESELDEPTPKKKSHLHMHIIPRTNKFDRLLREKYKGSCCSTILAWKIYTIIKHPEFPSQYKVNPANKRKLMHFIKSSLSP